MTATKIEDQPPPLANELPHVADVVIGWWARASHINYSAVIADMMTRKQLGIERYGVALQPHNGRNAMIDAYLECLDACQYLAQAIIEQGDHGSPEIGTPLGHLFWLQTSVAERLRKLIR